MVPNNNSQNFNMQSNRQNFNMQPQGMPQGQGNPSDSGGKKFKIFLLAGILVAVVLIGILAFTLLKGGDDSSDGDYLDDGSLQNDYTALERDFEVLEMVLASGIDEDYNIEPRSSAEFYAGEDLFVYARIGGFAEESYDPGFKHSIIESVFVYDSDSRIVDSMSKENIEKEASIFDKAGMDIKFSVKIPLESNMEEGNYVVELSYKDLISGETISMKKDFTVKSPEKVLGGRQASLRQDLSEIGIAEGSIFIQDASVYGPDNKLIESLSSVKEYTVPIGTEPVYDTKITIPNSYAPGEYRVLITTENKETGDKITEERVVVAQDRFEITGYAFYDEDNNEKEDNVYYPGDILVLKVDIAGFGYDFDEEKYNIHIAEDIATYDSENNMIEAFTMERYFEMNEAFDSRLEKYIIVNSLELPTYIPNDEYKISLTIYDEIMQISIKKDVYFVIEGSWDK